MLKKQEFSYPALELFCSVVYTLKAKLQTEQSLGCAGSFNSSEFHPPTPTKWQISFAFTKHNFQKEKRMIVMVWNQASKPFQIHSNEVIH